MQLVRRSARRRQHVLAVVAEARGAPLRPAHVIVQRRRPGEDPRHRVIVHVQHVADVVADDLLRRGHREGARRRAELQPLHVHRPTLLRAGCGTPGRCPSCQLHHGQGAVVRHERGRPLFEYTGAARSLRRPVKPPDGIRPLGPPTEPHLTGISFRPVPRPSSVRRRSGTGQAGGLIGQNCALCNCESKVARRTCQTRPRPRRRRFRHGRAEGFLPSEDHATENTGELLHSAVLVRDGLQDQLLATLLVTRGMAMLPPLVPAARCPAVERHQSLPCCRASSVISSMSLPGTPSVGIREGGEGGEGPAVNSLPIVSRARDRRQGGARPGGVQGLLRDVHKWI